MLAVCAVTKSTPAHVVGRRWNEVLLCRYLLSGVLSDIGLWFYWFVLNNSGQSFIMTSLESTSTYKCTSEATTKHIMPSLFPVRIPVPVLFSDGQSKQCDTAMGGCSHYLCSITFLWTCQAQKIFFQLSFLHCIPEKWR